MEHVLEKGSKLMGFAFVPMRASQGRKYGPGDAFFEVTMFGRLRVR